jgi:hypothetical protein
MTPFQLSTTAWIGGGVIGAALSKQHRVLGAGLGAILTGAISDVLIERYQAGKPLAGAAISGIGLVAFALYAIQGSR